MATCLPPPNGKSWAVTPIPPLVIRGNDDLQITKKLILFHTTACFSGKFAPHTLPRNSLVASTYQSVNMLADALAYLKKQVQPDQQQRAELFSREGGLLARWQTCEMARSAKIPFRCPQRLVVRGQRWQMHICCKEGVR